MSQTCSIAKSVVPCAEVFPVHQAMNELEGRLEELRKGMAELQVRLTCVMRPAAPEAPKDAGCPEPLQLRCLLANTLNERLDSIRQLTEVVRDMLNRLEV